MKDRRNSTFRYREQRDFSPNAWPRTRRPATWSSKVILTPRTEWPQWRSHFTWLHARAPHVRHAPLDTVRRRAARDLPAWCCAAAVWQRSQGWEWGGGVVGGMIGDERGLRPKFSVKFPDFPPQASEKRQYSKKSLCQPDPQPHAQSCARETMSWFVTCTCLSAVNKW